MDPFSIHSSRMFKILIYNKYLHYDIFKFCNEDSNTCKPISNRIAFHNIPPNHSFKNIRFNWASRMYPVCTEANTNLLQFVFKTVYFIVSNCLSKSRPKIVTIPIKIKYSLFTFLVCIVKKFTKICLKWNKNLPKQKWYGMQ